MNILQFFFGIFKECFNVLNVDVFHLGFTWLEFLLSGLLIFAIIKFVCSVVGVGDSIDLSMLMSQFRTQKYRMNNNSREKQLSSNRNNYVSSDFVDVWGDGTYIVSKKDYYKR